MRNAEAARYARWAAATGTMIAVVAAGVYVHRAWRQSRARGAALSPVPESVQQRSAEFSFSKVEQNRTIFTVRASSATEFKDQDRSLLEDVQITLYGRDGSRNDHIDTHECSYEPASGNIRCQGEVRMELETAAEARQPDHPRAIQVNTRDLSFNRESGEASTLEGVTFRFPGGAGRGTGLSYRPSDANVLLRHNVELQLTPPGKESASPVNFTGRSLEFKRNDSTIRLHGPVKARDGNRDLSAGELTLALDSEMHASGVVASGSAELHSADSQGRIGVTADEFRAELNPAGWVEQVVMEGNVRGSRQNPKEEDHFSAERVQFAMAPRENEPDEMTAVGNVQMQMQSAGNSQRLETTSLRLRFLPGEGTRRRRIGSGQTLTRATIASKTGDEETRISANKFDAEFNSRGQFEKLLGHAGVTIERNYSSARPQETRAHEMVATFEGGDWKTLGFDGGVQFRQGDRVAQADRARMSRTTDLIDLDGSPSVADAAARTVASWFKINQRTNEIRAGGGVRTTYQASAKDRVADLGSGPAHISAEALDGNSGSGHMVYSGQARLWQGDAVLDAETIELWRAEKRLDARGQVIAVIPERPGPHARTSGPTLWDIRAGVLHYWNDAGKARLEGGVDATSTEGKLHSKTLDLFLAPDGSRTAGPASAGNAAGSSGRQIERAVAVGDVVVRQGDRQGSAERAEYTAADGKFVLSGGKPTLTDASRDTTTGRSLTFFVASDTILVDSQEGLRTLTKHRVE
jgi:lipopolysaccharide export system protein LptA